VECAKTLKEVAFWTRVQRKWCGAVFRKPSFLSLFFSSSPHPNLLLSILFTMVSSRFISVALLAFSLSLLAQPVSFQFTLLLISQRSTLYSNLLTLILSLLFPELSLYPFLSILLLIIIYYSFTCTLFPFPRLELSSSLSSSPHLHL